MQLISEPSTRVCKEHYEQVHEQEPGILRRKRKAAETEHHEVVPVQGVTKPASGGEPMRYTHCERTDVGPLPSVKVARA
jgi:hypothetical protein